MSAGNRIKLQSLNALMFYGDRHYSSEESYEFDDKLGPGTTDSDISRATDEIQSQRWVKNRTT